MPKPLPKLSLAIAETSPLREAVGAALPMGRMKVHAITAGLGSSGYYSPDVIKEAADNELISRGTPLFLDHPTETDRHDRPERSVRDIAAVFTEAASYDDTEQALVGEIQVFAPYRELLSEMAPHIGLSISGSATDIVEGDVDGKRVQMIEGLAKIDSVDFVTRAGRGGKVVDLLESIRANKRALEHDGITEATVNDTREALQQELRDAYGGEKTYVWVRDFDDSTVWFEVENGDGSGIYGQTYTESDGVVALTGERVEVRVVTSYVPAARSDSTTTTQESKEDTMPQIEESELARLREADGRVPTLETERDTATRERDEARRELAEANARTSARDHARTRVTTGNALLPATAVDRIVESAVAQIPLTEAGELDEAAFDTRVDEARTAEETYLASLAEAAGAGKITGFGSTEQTTDAEESAPATTPWGRPLAVKGA